MKKDLFNDLLHPANIRYTTTLTGVDVKKQLANMKQLTFEVTNACNLNCKYCGYGEFYNTYDKRFNENLRFNIAKYIIDYLWEIWENTPICSQNREFVFGFYGGEPLLNISIIKQIVSYIESKPAIANFVFKYNMTTNAMLLDRDMDYLVEKEFSLLISLDGDEYAHSYRVDHANKNSYERVFKNILLLQKTYPDYFKKFVSFNSVLHNRNNVRGIRAFIKDKFDKVGLISELNQFGICPDKQVEFDKMFHPFNADIRITDDDYVDIFPNKMELFRFVGGISKNYYPSYNYLLRKTPNHLFPTGTCLPFGKKMFITVNGKILPCERIDQKYFLGHITDNGVDMDLDYIAQKYSDYYKKIERLCTKCYKKVFCSQCMFYMINFDDEIKCPSFTNKQDMAQYIDFHTNILYRYPELYQETLKNMLFEL